MESQNLPFCETCRLVPTGAMIVQMEQPITIGPNSEAFVGKRLLVGIRWTSKAKSSAKNSSMASFLRPTKKDSSSSEPIRDRGSSSHHNSERLRGGYRLRATGEVVRDPDYLATWKFDQDELPHLPEVPRGV